ncbi:MAG: Do family serine endopeptidase [Candidatus Eiseniibacteriota bacterium]
MSRSVRYGLAGLIALALALVLAAVPALAEGARQVPADKAQIQLSFAPIVRKVAPAVVNIYTKRVVETRPISPLFNDPFFRRFFGGDFQVGPQKRVQGSLGSGVILRSDGVIVTNHHVIDGAQQITVVLADRREFEATVTLSDERTDLAILHIDPGSAKLPTIELRDESDLEVGDLVLAVGNPFGVGQTVTSGIVSALARTTVGITDFRSFIQTDAAINPGNSGGALVSMDGRLVGVNTAIYSKSGGSIGIGFAIPASMVRTVLQAALSGTKLRRPWLGAEGQDVTAEIAGSVGLKHIGGVIIKDIYPNGPAAQAGLKDGDVVVGINGREISDGEDLRFRIATLPVGGTADLDIVRANRRLNLPIKLVSAPEDPPRNQTKLEGAVPLAGATVANLSPALAEEIGTVHGAARGVVIVAIDRASIAQRLRLEPGDIVVALNGDAVPSVAELKRLLSQKPPVWQLQINRAGQLINLNVRA